MSQVKKCPFCAEEIKTEAIKCRFCGEMLGPVASVERRLEYKTVRVPLGVSASVPSGHFGQSQAARDAAIDAGGAASPMITSALNQLSKDGWEPDEGTDLLSLFLAGQVAWRQTGGVLLSWKFTFDSVDIRFKRWAEKEKKSNVHHVVIDETRQPVTVADCMWLIPQSFRPENAIGVVVTIQYRFSGPEPGNWVLLIANGECAIEQGLAGRADVTCEAPSDVYLQFVRGEVAKMGRWARAKAFMKINWTGNLDITARMIKQKWFKNWNEMDLMPGTLEV